MQWICINSIIIIIIVKGRNLECTVVSPWLMTVSKYNEYKMTM